MTSKADYAEQLTNSVPEAAISKLCDFLRKHRVVLHIAKQRVSKLGDYRPPYKGKPHCISVNGNLNQYDFLITLLHEMAHLAVWLGYKNKVLPHGKEWQRAYAGILTEFIHNDTFPDDITPILLGIIDRPYTSGAAEKNLKRSLRRYDKDNGTQLLEDLPPGAYFLLRNNLFHKMKKGRTRYKCQHVKSKKLYLISAVVVVRAVSIEKAKIYS